ncbi:MAG: caspase family protein [Spirochaetales bacterium]
MGKKVVLMVALLLLASAAWAAEDEARYALVIGNASYDGDAALANSANDASDMADTLAAIGWKVTKLINGDRKAMNKALASFRDAMSGTRNPTALLFYAGHGVQINSQNYLLPVGETFETPDDITNDAMSLQTILNTFDDAKVLTNIVILDACRDNPFVKKNTRSLGGTRGLSVVNKSPNVEGSAVLFSTAPGDTAADGTGRNGVFTQALLKYLKTDLTLQQIATRVTKDVKTATGGKQTPYSSLALSDDFYMVNASLRTGTPAPASAGNVIVTAPAPAAVVAAPAAKNNNDVKATLMLQKATLNLQKQQVLQKGGPGGVVSALGWVLTLGGAGLGGYAYYAATQVPSLYGAATNQTQFDAARDQGKLMNILFPAGAGAAGAGLLTVISSLFMGADTSSIDKQITDVDRSLAQLGGS